MDISHIGNGNYYILIGGDELRGGDIAALVMEKILPFSGNTFLEVFSGEGGVIVFARVRRGGPIVFSFSEIETVISAAELCDSECVTFLAIDANEYKLIYYPWGNELPPAPLYEFCVSAGHAHPDYQRHIEEQGQVLLGPCAIEQIKEMFE